RIGLAEVLGGGADAVGDGAERVEVEAVELGLVEAEDLRGLVDRDVPEPLLQELPRVRPRALGVGEVVAPHDVADADLVAPSELTPTRVRRADLMLRSKYSLGSI